MCICSCEVEGRIFAKELAVGAKSLDPELDIPFPRLGILLPNDDTRELRADDGTLVRVPMEDAPAIELELLRVTNLVLLLLVVPRVLPGFELRVLEYVDVANVGIGDLALLEDVVELMVPFSGARRREIEVEAEAGGGGAGRAVGRTGATEGFLAGGTEDFGGLDKTVGLGLGILEPGFSSFGPRFQTLCTIDFAEDRKPNLDPLGLSGDAIVSSMVKQLRKN